MKKRFAALLAALTVITAVILPGGLYARAANYFPTTPIEFENLYVALFSQITLTTGNNNYFQNDNWKYYYRCSFTPQYSAEYTVTVSTKKKMKTELYDSEGHFISASYAPDDKNEEYRYIFSHTAFLEKGETYYYEFAYTNGYFNSCGPFIVSMTSTPAEEIPQDDYLHLYVKGKKSGSVYELSSYSVQQLMLDMSMKAVYSDGKLYEWNGTDTVIPYLNGCDIILDLSDCAETVGTHTVTAHFMGRKVTAQFEIVECIHTYTSSLQKPKWLECGCTVYTCSKCGKSYESDYTDEGAQLYSDFFDYFNTCKTDDDYSAAMDINNDGYINSRDYTAIVMLMSDAEENMHAGFNSKCGEDDYNPDYDMNSDGYINSRDIVELRRTKPAP